MINWIETIVSKKDATSLRGVTRFFFYLSITTSLFAIAILVSAYWGKDFSYLVPTGVQDFLDYMSNEGWISALKISIPALILILLNIVIHEEGHSIISKHYKANNIFIKMLSPFKWICDTKDEKFRKNLYHNNPKGYFILCISGVVTSTLLNLVMIVIIGILTIIDQHIFIIPCVLYCIQSALDYHSNIYKKNIKERPTSDGYRMNKALRYLETGIPQKFKY